MYTYRFGKQEMIVDLSNVVTFPQRPIGTILRAISATHAQTAVVTKKGILLVKKRIHGEVIRPMTLFESEGEWRASLPHYIQTLTVTEPVSAIQKNPITSSMTDPQKLTALQNKYKVRTGCYSHSLNNCRLISAKQSLAWAQQSGLETRDYEHDVKFWKNKCAEEGDEPLRPSYHGKNRIYLAIQDIVQPVTPFKNEQGEFIMNLNTMQAYKSFADIPGCLNEAGKPKLTVFYKDKYIGLAEQF